MLTTPGPVTPTPKPPEKPEDPPPPPAEEPPVSQPEPQPMPEPEPAPEAPAEDRDGEGGGIQLADLTDEVLEAMPVVKLRSAARSVGLNTMTRKEIRFAKKEELVAAIRAFRDQ